MQYEVKFQNGQECGGAYVKLLTKEPKLKLVGYFQCYFLFAVLFCLYFQLKNHLTQVNFKLTMQQQMFCPSQVLKKESLDFHGCLYP